MRERDGEREEAKAEGGSRQYERPLDASVSRRPALFTISGSFYASPSPIFCYGQSKSSTPTMGKPGRFTQPRERPTEGRTQFPSFKPDAATNCSTRFSASACLRCLVKHLYPPSPLPLHPFVVSRDSGKRRKLSEWQQLGLLSLLPARVVHNNRKQEEYEYRMRKLLAATTGDDRSGNGIWWVWRWCIWSLGVKNKTCPGTGGFFYFIFFFGKGDHLDASSP